eukprot:151117_1
MTFNFNPNCNVSMSQIGVTPQITNTTITNNSHNVTNTTTNNVSNTYQQEEEEKKQMDNDNSNVCDADDNKVNQQEGVADTAYMNVLRTIQEKDLDIDDFTPLLQDCIQNNNQQNNNRQNNNQQHNNQQHNNQQHNN